MEQWYKGLVLTLGVILGVFSPGPKTELASRVFRDAGFLFVQAEIRDGGTPELLALLEGGEPLELELLVTAQGEGYWLHRSVRHKIHRDLLAGGYRVVRENDDPLETASLEAALILLFSSRPVAVCPLEILTGPFTVTTEARLFLPERPEADAGLLWKYRTPRQSQLFASVSDLPR